jgi:hypothetical protein
MLYNMPCTNATFQTEVTVKKSRVDGSTLLIPPSSHHLTQQEKGLVSIAAGANSRTETTSVTDKANASRTTETIKPLTELEKFLHAVDSQELSSSKKRPHDIMTSEEESKFRRERNRVLAKQTRERKKSQVMSLKDHFQSLHRENAMLKRLVKNHVRQPQTILEGCTAASKVPADLWECYEITKEQEDETEDEEEESTPQESSNGVASGPDAIELSVPDDNPFSAHKPIEHRSSIMDIPNPLHGALKQPVLALFGKPVNHFWK